jgi:antitoxin component YwqK of YwqJK toxin-antitoxin module
MKTNKQIMKEVAKNHPPVFSENGDQLFFDEEGKLIKEITVKTNKQIMENLQIKIVITDGEKEAKTSINVKDYQMMKKLHGVSLIDEQFYVLLNEIKDLKTK